jgi:hypothetical protein
MLCRAFSRFSSSCAASCGNTHEFIRVEFPCGSIGYLPAVRNGAQVRDALAKQDFRSLDLRLRHLFFAEGVPLQALDDAGRLDAGAPFL